MFDINVEELSLPTGYNVGLFKFFFAYFQFLKNIVNFKDYDFLVLKIKIKNKKDYKKKTNIHICTYNIMFYTCIFQKI